MKETIEEIKNFLINANSNTYANKKAVKDKPSRLESRDYHYEEGDLIYHDTYFGSEDFIGEEIVYKNKLPLWGMNYFGFLIDKEINEKEVYDFLRKVLMQSCENEIPVRGPTEFSEGDLKYKIVVQGNLENFFGEEQILFQGNVVYRCFVHGGLIR